jgi:DNA repair exonuclease SbcCD ATPase subunit
MMRAVEVLRKYQKQCDPEGIEVQVSRQALDEVLDEIERLQKQCEALGDNCIRHGENIHALELLNAKQQAEIERLIVDQGQYEEAIERLRSTLQGVLACCREPHGLGDPGRLSAIHSITYKALEDSDE